MGLKQVCLGIIFQVQVFIYVDITKSAWDEPVSYRFPVTCKQPCECVSLLQSGGGEIDLREYVVALSVVCRPSQTLATIQLAFKVSGLLEWHLCICHSYCHCDRYLAEAS